MSLYSDIRALADSNFQQENRLQGVAFAVALALAVKYINTVDGNDTVENTYLQYVYKPASETISLINENVLTDIRYCMDLTKKLFVMMYNVKYRPISVSDNGSSLSAVLFDVESYFPADTLEFFKQNKTGIVNIFNRLNQE
jgi:hypothetical protein